MSLSQAQVSAAAAVSFSNGTDVVTFFDQNFGQHYIDWFNTNCANKGKWVGKKLGSSDAIRSSFVQLWDGIPETFGTDSIDLLKFVGLMGILTIETGGALEPVSERCGHLGLAYPFNAIAGVKRSYNDSAQGNKLAGALFFEDQDYWNAHGTRTAADTIRARPDLQQRWNGVIWPEDIASALPSETTAFLQQADFYKFRGRGFIQTTWRTNYKKLVAFIQAYKGADPVLTEYSAKWAGQSPDLVCTLSTNDDWDTLFEQTGLIVACRAIGLHNEVSGRYLALAKDAATLMSQSDTPGSFYRVGYRINGGHNYAALYSAGVIEILTTLNYLGQPSAAEPAQPSASTPA